MSTEVTFLLCCSGYIVNYKSEHEVQYITTLQQPLFNSIRLEVHYQCANYIFKHCLHLKPLEKQQIVPTYIAHHFSNAMQ